MAAAVPDRLEGLLPPGALPCIWMGAGLVAYKLCDRGLDCDGCPFDRAMRGEAAPRAPEPPRLAPGTAAGRFPADRLYHRSHAWTQDLEGGRLRLGIDAFAARLLGRVGSVILPPLGSHLQRGQAACWLGACWLGDKGEPLAVRSPASGVVTGRNPRVHAEPNLVTASPYEEGWLLEISPSGPAPPAELMDARQAEELARRHRAELGRRAAAELATARAVGATLPDGGEPVGDLKEMLGPARYRRLLEHFLG